MTAVDTYVTRVLDHLPPIASMRDQIAMEVRSHIAERLENGRSEQEALDQMGDPVRLAESYLAAIPLVSASFWQRAAAKLVDALIVTMVALIALVPFVAAIWTEWGGMLSVFGILLVVLIVAPGFCLYSMIGESRYGTTVGKHVLGLLVVRESGARISFGQALVRQLPLFLEVFWIDVLFALFTEKRQRAFELLSKTRVVIG